MIVDTWIELDGVNTYIATDGDLYKHLTTLGFGNLVDFLQPILTDYERIQSEFDDLEDAKYEAEARADDAEDEVYDLEDKVDELKCNLHEIYDALKEIDTNNITDSNLKFVIEHCRAVADNM